jgi:hypothetical protein
MNIYEQKEPLFYINGIDNNYSICRKQNQQAETVKMHENIHNINTLQMMHCRRTKKN